MDKPQSDPARLTDSESGKALGSAEDLTQQLASALRARDEALASREHWIRCRNEVEASYRSRNEELIRERDEALKERDEARKERDDLKFRYTGGILQAALNEAEARLSELEAERDEARKNWDAARAFAKASMDVFHLRLLNARISELEAALAEARAEIDAAWFGIEHGWDIETRAELEAAAKTNGFKFGLAQAVHHMWKRELKEAQPQVETTPERKTLSRASERSDGAERQDLREVTNDKALNNELSRTQPRHRLL